MQVFITTSDADDYDFIASVLRRAGFDPLPWTNLKVAVDQWLDRPADLVVVATRSPDEHSNLSNDIRGLRISTQVPVLVLVESPSELDVTKLLSVGADVVLSLPLGPKVLSGYAHALLRRSGGVPPLALPILDLDEITLNPSNRSVCIANHPSQRLTQLEFRLLYVLMTHRGQAIPYEVIVDRVWGYAESGSRELVRGLVSRLRSKIAANPSSPHYIHTIPGIGYMFSLAPPD